MTKRTEYSLYNALMTSYASQFDKDGVRGERIAKRLDALSKIGLTNDLGSNRPGFSQEEKQAKALVMSWMEEAGLDVEMDGAGNVIGRLAGKNNELKSIASGSHVDSVPNGGHFDGPLGVISALEVVEAWKETNYIPNKPFDILIFSDEEGSRFNNGLNGSEAFVGQANVDSKLDLTDAVGDSFSTVLEAVDLTVEGYANAAKKINDIETFVEVHIEQGKRLEKEDLPCGIVTGIAGPCWLEVTFHGQAGHAGNTPMNDRADALVTASTFITRVPDLPAKVSDSAVATVGKMHVQPNGVNVIPGEVTVFVDIRDIYAETVHQLVEDVKQLAHTIAKERDQSCTIKEQVRITPVPIKKDYQKKLASALESHHIRPFYLPSGAGHDAIIIGSRIPVSMLFVRSKDGVSHHPDEWTDLADCVQGVRVLKTYIEQLQ